MSVPDLIGMSPGIARIREQLTRVAGRGADAGRLPSVLLQGETGTGKGLVARALHAASGRRMGPFVDINCAAIPESLLEAELFGFERGAFTDARQAKPGLFQAATRGTIFLDEVALLSAGLQGKLLKVVEERAVRRLGATRSEPVDAWVIAATSVDLEEAARAARFRLDLYHRLAVITLRLPALRERGDDVVLLAEHFLARVCADYRLRTKSLSADARDALRAHTWPGNVRELSNVIERTALLAEAPVLTADMLELPEEGPGAREDDADAASLRDTLRLAERERLLQVLHETRWNLSQAAARLALPRNTLLYRMERQGLRPPPPSRRRSTAPPPAADPGNVPDAPAGGPPVRRRVTLLRVELVGPETTPLDAAGTRVIDSIAEKVTGFGGRVEAAAASHVTAVFGVEPVEDAPRRAALAALAVEKLSERDPRGGRPVAIGIHVAECFLEGASATLRADDADTREAWTVLAAASGAAAGMIAVTPAAARLLERRFDLSRLGPGREAPDLHRLTGPERPGFVLSGRITTFTGRQPELALLAGRLDSVLEGRGQVVALVGEPGMGKSRLLSQFRQAAAGRPVTWLEGQCLSYASNIPYLPMLAIVRAACGIGDADDATATADRVSRALCEAGRAAEDAPYLLHLLGSDVAAERLRHVGPEQLKVRTFDVLRHLLLEASRHRPLIVAVEDLHWIDKTSDEVLALLVDGLAVAPILLAVTYRPGYEPAWLSRSYVTQLSLPRLSNEDSLVVLRSTLLDRPDVPAATLAHLAGRGDGNPFFLEELARAFDEHGGADTTLAVPGTIEGVLGGRIERLLPSDKRLLQTAAVIGRDVPLEVLRAVAEEPEGLRASLDRLRSAEFLYDARPGPDAACTFKHALTQEVAYQTLTRDQRRERHGKVADALRALSPDFAETRPEVLARHLTAAERAHEALPLWLLAGQEAIRRSANVEAVSHLRSALTLLRSEAPSAQRDRRELEMQLALGAPLLMTQGYASADVEALYRRAEVLCEEVCEPPQLFAALWGISIFHVVRGDLQKARAVAERLLAAASRSGSDDLQVEAHLAYGAALFHEGRLAEARTHLEQCVALYDPERHAGHAFVYGQDPCVAGLGFLGRTLVLQGHEAEAASCIERGLRRAEAIDHPFTRTFALLNAAQLHELRSDFRALLPYAEQALALAMEHRFPFLLGAAVTMRGQALVAAGAYAEGLRLITGGVQTWRATGASLSLAYYLGVIADAHRAAGEREAGLALVAEALATAARTGELISETDLHRIQGELLAADRSTEDQAPAAFERGIALARRQGALLFARRAAASFRRYLGERGRDEETETLMGAWAET